MAHPPSDMESHLSQAFQGEAPLVKAVLPDDVAGSLLNAARAAGLPDEQRPQAQRGEPQVS